MMNHHHQRRPRILLGITGSIAAVKGPRLAIRLASELKAHVKVILTRTVELHFWKEKRACETYDGEGWREFGRWIDAASAAAAAEEEEEDAECEDWRLSNGRISVHYAEEEWNNYKSLQDPVLHIELRKWADICLIAPLSAHTLAKLANGLCDDLLTCCLRAWDFGQRTTITNSQDGQQQQQQQQRKPIILAPAMNTAMWDHPLTRVQLETIQQFGRGAAQQTSILSSDASIGSKICQEQGNDQENGVIIVEPAVKTLACGDVGAGALADLDDILLAARKCLESWIVVNEEKDSVTINNNPSQNDDKFIKIQSANHTVGNKHSPHSSSSRHSMKKALLLYAKSKFREMQSSHQQQHQETPCDTSSASIVSSTAASLLAAPISPTPNLIIETFLPHLNLDSKSLLIDLGCGDGRWLIAAAKITSCKCLGIDVDKERLGMAQNGIISNGLDKNNQVQVRNQDVFEFVRSDNDMFWKANVFVLYLFREAMVEIGSLLRQRLCNEFPNNNEKSTRAKTKLISVGFALHGWTPIHEEKKNGIRVYLYCAD